MSAQSLSYAVYDVTYAHGGYFLPTADIVTIMCAQGFTVNAPMNQGPVRSFSSFNL